MKFDIAVWLIDVIIFFLSCFLSVFFPPAVVGDYEGAHLLSHLLKTRL